MTAPFGEFVRYFPATIVNVVADALTPYNVSWYELVVLSAIARSLEPGLVLELGTFDGRTAAQLALNCPGEARVVSVDIAAEVQLQVGASTRPVPVGSFLEKIPRTGNIELVTADSRSHDFSTIFGQAALVFVDGDHSYDGVLADTRVAFDVVRPGGYVVWHDYLMIGDVTRALESIAAERPLVHIDDTTLVFSGPAAADHLMSRIRSG
ncbi:MAG TPA: class I SAM-dependent methyltransferase [Acidimicrobiales bacterium]|nr:class I SAM-dependent methyltransferase [Acidimicrobiales bacterium]